MGDLISREALLENYDLKNAVKYGNKTEEQRHNSYSTLMLYEVADMIWDAPAVDAVEVVHGRWGEYVVVGYNGIKPVWARPCSECGHENLALANNYCPKCGAKMDAAEAK